MTDILVVGKYYAPFSGGVEENTRVVAEGLAGRGHDVAVICNNHAKGSSDEMMDGVRVVRTSTLAVLKSQPIGISTFFKTLRFPAKVVHFHSPNPWLAVALWLRFKVRKNPGSLVVTHHMDIYGRPILRFFARKVFNALLKDTSLLIATSLRNITSSDDISVKCNSIAIPLGLDLDKYTLSDEKRAEARAWGRELSGGRPIVAFMGRHARYKGLDVLIDAIASDPQLYCIIGGDGPCNEATRRQVADLGIADRVKFLGFISHDEKLRLLAAADVFAFPSTEKTEAYGISQVEAMALKVPVVATNLPTGVVDVARHDDTAIVVEPGNSVAFAEAIAKVIADEEYRTKIVGNAYDNVVNNLSNDILIEKNVKCIEGVL
ncbi:glycosyltransferase [Novosphingobium guangzhouense]|uniref:Glycosyl transferase family 1 n=1 Tax=Novosphingobium guangzhouense TaxID=1850347 RepID=A0A2K2FZV9_9SPHN|nr:glycosyltransferase [Novosphingobium guangzhouense]PNU04339.1 hypothetical protein A8V01_20865 [Novosphingobium guangzhouense]